MGPFLTSHWRQSDHPSVADLKSVNKIIFNPPPEVFALFLPEANGFRPISAEFERALSQSIPITKYHQFRNSVYRKWTRALLYEMKDGQVLNMAEIDDSEEAPMFLRPSYYFNRAREINWVRKIEELRKQWGRYLLPPEHQSSLRVPLAVAGKGHFRPMNSDERFLYYQYWAVVLNIIGESLKRGKNDLTVEILDARQPRTQVSKDIRFLQNYAINASIQPSGKLGEGLFHLWCSPENPTDLEANPVFLPVSDWSQVIEKKWTKEEIKLQPQGAGEDLVGWAAPLALLVAEKNIRETKDIPAIPGVELKWIGRQIVPNANWTLSIETLDMDTKVAFRANGARPLPRFWIEVAKFLEKERGSRRHPMRSLKILLREIELAIRSKGTPSPNAEIQIVAEDTDEFLTDDILRYTWNSELPFLFLLRAIASFLVLREETKPTENQPVLEMISAVLQWTEKNEFILSGQSPNWLLSLLDLQEHGIEVQVNGAPLLKGLADIKFDFNLSESPSELEGSWFDLNPQIFFNGELITAPDMTLMERGDFIQFRGNFYRVDKNLLPSFQVLMRFWRRVLQTKGKGLAASREQKVYRLARSQALELLVLRAQGIQVRGGPEWQRICDYFDNRLGKNELLNNSIWSDQTSKQLLDYQKFGAQFLYDLYQLRLGALLADEMGLGKTFQTLAFLLALKIQHQLGRVLVVVPTSVLANWIEERDRFATELPLELLRSDQIPGAIDRLRVTNVGIVLISYGTLSERENLLSLVDWQVVIFDEAQYLKNIQSQRTSAARKLKARFKMALTGTPLENNLAEFYSIVDLLVPGALGELKEFRKEYLSADLTGEPIAHLKALVKPLMLRRTKTEVNLKLPARVVHSVSLEFTEVQKDLYKKMAYSFTEQVEKVVAQQGESSAQLTMLTALMRLRQICSDPAGLPGVVYKEIPPKLALLEQSTREILEDGNSVLIFTQFLKTLERTESYLRDSGLSIRTIHGGLNSKERTQVLDWFRGSSEPQILLMTLKTGGVGLNLTKASVVYHLEPWWNPAVENQASDRAHRMGQEKDVHVYNLLMKGSLEERIRSLKLKKQEVFDALFAKSSMTSEVDEELHPLGGSTHKAGLTMEDFRHLLAGT